MGLGSQLADGLKPVVDLVYPPRCPLCGVATADQGGLCTDCWGELEFSGEPGCKSCSRPMPESHGDDICFACIAQPPVHSGIHAGTLYNEASRKLILSFKHGRKIALAGLFARLMASRLPSSSGVPPLLVPVPLHRWRIWQRGFNQAALLAQELARLGKGELLVDGLRRVRKTPSLGGLGRLEREKALAGAIITRRRAFQKVAGRQVILVDDVLTSGATSDACVSALLSAGAVSVKIACFARVIDGDVGRERKIHAGQQSETPEAITASGAT